MIGRIYLVVIALWLVGIASAFAPMSNSKNHGMSQVNLKFQQAHVVPSFTRISEITIRSLSSTEPESESTSDATAPTTTTKAVSADGTFYDDEVK
jgi:hypothetical protein